MTRLEMALTCAACLALLFTPCAMPQSAPKSGWEGSIGLFYQDEQDVGFDGRALLKADDGVGIIGAVGYSFNPRLDLVFGFEAITIDYELIRQSASTLGRTQSLRTEYDSFTPFVKINYNILDRAFSPFVSAGIGWAFIDTNIPEDEVFLGCWWDPWWGYVCSPYAETKQTDAFAYNVGIGARWLFNDAYGLRLEYQKQWLELSKASGAPNFDQLRLTFVAKYW